MENNSILFIGGELLGDMKIINLAERVKMIDETFDYYNAAALAQIKLYASDEYIKIINMDIRKRSKPYNNLYTYPIFPPHRSICRELENIIQCIKNDEELTGEAEENEENKKAEENKEIIAYIAAKIGIDCEYFKFDPYDKYNGSFIKVLKYDGARSPEDFEILRDCDFVGTESYFQDAQNEYLSKIRIGVAELGAKIYIGSGADGVKPALCVQL